MSAGEVYEIFKQHPEDYFTPEQVRIILKEDYNIEIGIRNIAKNLLSLHPQFITRITGWAKERRNIGYFYRLKNDTDPIQEHDTAPRHQKNRLPTNSDFNDINTLPLITPHIVLSREADMRWLTDLLTKRQSFNRTIQELATARLSVLQQGYVAALQIDLSPDTELVVDLENALQNALPHNTGVVVFFSDGQYKVIKKGVTP